VRAQEGFCFNEEESDFVLVRDMRVWQPSEMQPDLKG
jgi:hypothetical protein